MRKRALITAAAVIGLHLFFRSMRYEIPSFIPGGSSQTMGRILVAASVETRLTFLLGLGSEWIGLFVLTLLAVALVTVIPFWRQHRGQLSWASIRTLRPPKIERALQFRLFFAGGIALLCVLTYLTVFLWLGTFRSTILLAIALTLTVGLLIGLIYGVAWFERRDRLDPPRR